jgi:NAD(P)-dependent dehydrogenase (short-subunit alcohol dehydrogenase family)
MPIGRFGTPEEIAASILHLSSDSSSFITGQAMIVDGGLTAG